MQILKPHQGSSPKMLGMPKTGHFNMNDEEAYKIWRDKKLSTYPIRISEQRVEIENPEKLTTAERKLLIQHCQKTNMVFYQLKHANGDPADKIRVKRLGEQLGLSRLDSNLCADNDSISSLKVVQGGRRQTYIPYSNLKISWHTDGYYNSAVQQIRGMLLHCINPAAQGGENGILDPEIAYIHLRDSNPNYIYALMHPQVMTIPANEENGKLIRTAQTGPIFSINATGKLHMRYTARTRSIEWRDDETTLAALKCLASFLKTESEYIFQHKLEAGQGLICNNILHNRSAFEEEGAPRLLYRARYIDRIQGT
ncbi:FIG00779168: hypothetical protein [hydrothermal vent metagenome]|uniref:TauD/TfdA-like domain-containing protein n=1 Tax=hydrothermal vent metagenome TaxID=652676 RepID=A0A3B1AXH6_9ZZZZ